MPVSDMNVALSLFSNGIILFAFSRAKAYESGNQIPSPTFCFCILNVVHVFENYKNCNEYPVTCYICNEYSQPWAYGHTTLEQHKFMSVLGVVVLKLMQTVLIVAAIKCCVCCSL